MRKKRRANPNNSVNNSTAVVPHQKALNLFANELMNRMTLAYSAAGNIGVTHNGARDLYTILGYKKELCFDDYIWRYERQDIATRIVTAFPSACWSMKPIVSESDTPANDTAFEKAFADMVIDNKVYHYLTRADKLSGIGKFGIIVLGFADSKKLSQPVVKKQDMELIYMRPYHEGSVTIDEYETDATNKRYMLPKIYSVNTAVDEIANSSTQASSPALNTVKVHWTRVIHIVPELGTENDIFGIPRLKNVYNRLQDVETISGGGAEMFWRGAFQGLAFKNDEGATMGDPEKAALEAEIEDYVNNMKRYIKLQNMDVNPIETQVADPKNHFDVQITLIAAAKEIPKRILIGSERGELASSQDEVNWNKKVDERRVDHSELIILRPFIDRMIEFGALPEPATPYEVVWPDLYAPSGEEKAKVAEALMRALKDYLTMPDGQMVIPNKMFLQKIMGFSEKEVNQAEEIIKNMSRQEIDDILRDENIDENRDNNANNN